MIYSPRNLIKLNTVEKKLFKRIKETLDEREIEYTTEGDVIIAKTRYGDWNIKPDHTNRSKLITIYTRFENPELLEDAKGRRELENYHIDSWCGKCNFHYQNKHIENMFCAFSNLCLFVA